MRFAITALLLIILLPACTQVSSKNSSLILPDVVRYPQEAQNKAADEVLGGQCPMIAERFMIDYKVMRDQTRAAKKIIKK